MKLAIHWTCSDYTHHEHRYRCTAWLCGRLQQITLRQKLKAIGWLWIAWAFVLSWITVPYYFGKFVDYQGPAGWCATACANAVLIVGIFLIYNREKGSARILAWIGWKFHRRKWY